jgi:predicted RNA binding protein YcfA (HicA-like mRNA interferase family)
VPRIPGVNHLDAVRALEKAGFQVIRQGKHIVMSDGIRQVSISRHNPIKAFTMGGIAKRCRSERRRVPQVAVIERSAQKEVAIDLFGIERQETDIDLGPAVLD